MADLSKKPARKRRSDGGITKTPPKPWILPLTVTVEEGSVFVVRDIVGGGNYRVLKPGVHLYVPRLVHDPVASVSTIPFQFDVGPFEVTVKSGNKVGLDVKFECCVGDVAWNWIEVEVSWARAQGVWLTEVAAHDRLPVGEQTGWIRVHHPTDPILPVRFEQTDASIIRAAINAGNIKDEVEKSLRSALNEAAMLLGITTVVPTDVARWLTDKPQPIHPGRLPIARRGAINREELMEQTAVMAAQSLEPFGLALFDLRIQEVILSPKVAEAAERRQVAAQELEASQDSAAAIKARFDAVDGGRLTGISHGLAATEALRLQAGREGVTVPPLVNVVVGTGSLLGGGNTQASPGGGGGNKGPGGKPGGRGAPKKRP